MFKALVNYIIAILVVGGLAYLFRFKKDSVLIFVVGYILLGIVTLGVMVGCAQLLYIIF